MQCYDGNNFLLAETEVVMTTLISSCVQDKICIFTRYKPFRLCIKDPGISSIYIYIYIYILKTGSLYNAIQGI